MDFGQAITTGFKKYVTFAGRASRSEYWFWVLFTLIGGIVTATLDYAMFSDNDFASPPSAEMAAHLPGSDFVSCFLPCTPNPTTGFFFYAPRDKVIDLDITVEQAMTLIMSAGMAQPNNGEAQKRLAALVESGRPTHAAVPRMPIAPVK